MSRTTKKEKNVNLVVRIAKEEREEFNKLCRENGKIASEEIRKFINAELKKGK
jgi:hypothetical protein